MDDRTFPPMKRRVNPDSLASRLEPELVREMNALIMPGNIEMPSFAVRKELQERYNIDRRHIYDYFHSKGLRVVKDDKVNNIVRRTNRPTKVPQATLRPLRQAQPRKYHSLDNRHDISFPRRKCDKLYAADRITKQAKKYSRSIPTSRTQVVSGASTCFIESPSSPQPLQIYHLDDDNMTSDFNLPVKLTKDFAWGFNDTRHSDQHMDIPGGDAPVGILNDCLSENHEISLILPPDGPLTKEERMAIYNSLDAILGPACGIQESVGTYRKYMEDQSRLYYQRLYENSPRTLAYTSCEASISTATLPRASEDQADFRKWLVYGQRSSGSYQNFPESRLCASVRLSCTGNMDHEVENDTLSKRFKVSETPFSLPCINETGDTALDDFVPELTPIDVLRHLLDPFDPVERTTVPCSGEAMKDHDKLISPTELEVLSNDGPTSLSPFPSHQGICNPCSKSLLFNEHGRNRNIWMNSSADLVDPMDAEASIPHTAVNRNSRRDRKRSSSTVTTRLRATSGI